MAQQRRPATAALIGAGVLLALASVADAFMGQQLQQALLRQGQQHQCSSRTGVRTLVARAPEFGRKAAKREMMERERAMAEFNAEIETTPVFQVFAATEKMKGLWKPVAAFKADNVAKGVVDASLQEGMAANMFKGVYKAQVETAVSKAIFDNEKRLREQGASMHATLRAVPRDQIIWGYKIMYKPLQDKEGKTAQPKIVTRDMAKSLFDKFKDGLSSKVQETFSLSFDDSTEMAAKPAAPAAGEKKKGKKAKKKAGAEGEGAAAAAAAEGSTQ